MRTPRILNKLLTATLGLALVSGGGVAVGLAAEIVAGPAAAYASSSIGGPITRSEVMMRALDWYNQRGNIPYSQTGRYPDVNGTEYRTDCSGYVSMSLHLAAPGLITATFPSSANVSLLSGSPSSGTDLRPGDFLDNTVDGHMVLFDAWESDHVHFSYYSFGSTPISHGTHRTFSDATISGWPTSHYKAYRYDKIIDDSAGSLAGPAVAYDMGDGTMKIFRWSSNGSSFSSYTTFDSGSFSLNSVGGRMATGDVNGDGHQDTVMAYQKSDGTFQFNVFRNGDTSAGVWYTSGPFNLGNVGGRLVVGDFNGDGKAEPALVYNNGDGTMKIYRWLSTGTSFSRTTDYQSGPFSLSNVGDRVAAGDVNGDGKDDIVMAYQKTDGTFQYNVFPNGSSSAGVWYTSGPFNLGNVGGRLVVGDFNGDGKAEPALVYNNGDGTMKIYRWLSTGTSFSRTTDYQSGPFSLSNVGDRVAAGDVNGDGKDDIAMAYQKTDGTFQYNVFPNGSSSAGVWYTSGHFDLDNVGGRLVVGAW